MIDNMSNAAIDWLVAKMANFNFDLRYAGGACPFQAEGTFVVNGEQMAFYYRERSGNASLSIDFMDSCSGRGASSFSSPYTAHTSAPEFRANLETLWVGTFCELLRSLAARRQRRFTYLGPKVTAHYDDQTAELHPGLVYQAEMGVELDESYVRTMVCWGVDAEEARADAFRFQPIAWLTERGHSVELQRRIHELETSWLRGELVDVEPDADPFVTPKRFFDVDPDWAELFADLAECPFVADPAVIAAELAREAAYNNYHAVQRQVRKALAEIVKKARKDPSAFDETFMWREEGELVQLVATALTDDGVAIARERHQQQLEWEQKRRREEIAELF